MGTPKFSTFIIGLVWVSFFAAIFGGFISNLFVNYNVDYDSTQVERFNKMEQLNLEVKSYQNSSTSFTENTAVFDVIGGYFSNGYKTMKAALSSLDLFKDMTTDALNTPALKKIPSITYLQTAIILTVLILIIIGVLLSAIVKKDL
jgi:hypothetical protein